jgi:hypothetical protein
MVPREQYLHCEPVAGRDLCNQRRVGVVFVLRVGRSPGDDPRGEPNKVIVHW